MPQSWSSIRKRLEQDLLCEKLRGRVQYFRTIYHGAPDEYGRFAVRVDGKEIFQANPYNENNYSDIAWDIKQEREIPPREGTGKEDLHDAENLEAEEEARMNSVNDGIVDSFDIPWAIKKYLNQDIAASLSDEDPLVRMFAILDRRVGKRTLKEIAETVSDQPEWLQQFYRLRLDAEGIRSEYDKAGMKRVLLSADNSPSIYLVPSEVADDLDGYCNEFANNWLRHDKRARKYHTGHGLCYNEEDFVEYLNRYIFPDRPSEYVETIELEWNGREEILPEKYKEMKWFNF